MFGKLLFFFVFPKLGISYKAKKAQPYGYAPKISLSFQIILKYMLSIQQGR